MNPQDTAQQPISEVRKYFTDEINKSIAEMDEKEMLVQLKELSGTRYWIAILKYNQARLAHAQNFLFSADPFKDPTGISRYQGLMLGLSDLANAVILTLEQDEERVKEAEEARA